MKRLKNWWSRRAMWFKIAVPSVIILLIVARAVAPTIIKSNVLAKLNSIECYSATLEDVDISLFSLSITFKKLRIFSDSTGRIHPLFQADVIKGELITSSINEGKMLTHSTVVNPVFFFGKMTVEDSAGVQRVKTNHDYADEINWRKEIRQIFALTIDQFDVENGAIYFYDYTNNSNIELKADSINAHFENLANISHSTDRLYGKGVFTAQIMDHAPLEVDIKIDPTSEKGDYNLDLELTDLDVTQLNSFWKRYVNLDVEKGHFSLYSSLEMKDGFLTGNIKPESHDFEIFDLEFDKQLGFRNMAWQAIIGAASRVLLLNDFNKEKICKIEFSGTYDHLTVKLKKNSEKLMSRMFVRAINKKIDKHTVEFVKLD